MITHFINPKLREYVYSLEKPTVSKFIRLTDLLERFGEKLGMPYTKQIQTNLYELRIRGQQEVRIFYCFYCNKTALARIKLLTKT